MTTPAELQALDLCKHFIDGTTIHQIIKGITTTFVEGKSYAIIGASGSGKSTFLHLLAGLDIPTSGKILFNKKNLSFLYAAEKDHFRQNTIGLVFQFHYLINELTALENIIVPGLIQGRLKNECIKEAHYLLESIDLLNKKDHYPCQLSGGEQQRIAILRALFNRPRFLIADEPTGSLDAQNAELVVSLLLRFHKEYKIGLILCTHDQMISNKMETIIKIENGQIKG